MNEMPPVAKRDTSYRLLLLPLRLKYILKVRKHAFKSINNFFQSLLGQPILHKALILTTEILHVFETQLTWVSKAQWVPPRLANARPLGRAKLVKAPPLGPPRQAFAPQLPGGGGRAQLELNDALLQCYSPAMFKSNRQTQYKIH